VNGQLHTPTGLRRTPINKEAVWDPEPVLDVLLRGFEPRTVQPAANLYTDNAIPVDC